MDKKIFKMQKIALITGATAGIGEAVALSFAENGINVIITGRREERLSALKSKLEAKNVQALALCFDVCDETQVKSALASLPDEWKNIDILVNNAGLASGLSNLQEGDTDDWNKMIDTNVKGLLYVTRHVSPRMIERKRGHIVNIGSIAGREVYPYGNVYCATKHAVDALSKAMRIDMLKHSIKVTNICPGIAETEFSLVRFKDDKERAKQPYIGLEPLTGEDIARTILFVISQPKHVCINDLLIMPTAQANGTNFYRV